MIPKLLPAQAAKGGYRRDIDGLRAIAVLSVVAFHFSEHVMPGGYLGVDVFFVLSGYLITGIIVREAGEGRFSIARFYERRVRRIAPALLLVLSATTAIAALMLLPLDLEGYGKSLIASLAFVANIYFWRDGNYFAQGAETKPLLHIWSLGVEEQFYIFFPLLVLLLARRQGWLFACIVVAVVGSLLLNIWLLRSGYASIAFYLLPSRAWELGAGALLVFAGPPKLPRALAETLMVTAYALLFAAIFFAPLWVPHPLPTALPAVAATALLIWLGNGEDQLSASMPLRIAPMVGIGMISYSLYLWHWPLIVFANYYFVEGYGVGIVAVLLVAMFACAWASWRFVERPFRRKDYPLRRLYTVTGLWALALALAGGGLVWAKGLPDRLSPEIATINAAIGSHYRCPISLTIAYEGVRGCWFGEGEPADADLLLLGNSHAQMYAPILRDGARRSGRELLMIPANGCAPLVGVNIRPGCIPVAGANIEAAARHPAATTVVIAFVWGVAEDLVDADGRAQGDPQGALIAGLDATIARLTDAGKQVVIVGPIATPEYELPSELGRSMAFSRAFEKPLAVSEQAFLGGAARYLQHYRNRSDIELIEPHRIQCDGGSCRYLLDGTSLFADKTHLSSDALPVFAPAFAPLFDTASPSAGEEGNR